MKLTSRGLFERVVKQSGQRSVDLANMRLGINCSDDIFFKLNEGGRVQWVVSRTCDHSNGKLRLNSDGVTATCPLHNWKLSLERLTYENVQLKKECLPFRQEGSTLFYEQPEISLRIAPALSDGSNTSASIRFLAHACVEIAVEGITIVSDPWLVGPCFTTGWWHDAIPAADALEITNGADAIYLSHNHPDHLHLETLKRVDRNKPLIIPDFKSRSVEKIVRAMGFTELHILSFGTLFEIEDTKILVSILPSGDFRDDSGLFVSHGDFSALLTVDANRLNQYILPERPSVLLSSFASGATGYPLCFEMYSDEQKASMLARNCRTAMGSTEKYILSTEPSVFMPYAGYFTEAAPRDRYIKEHNRKNGAFFAKEYLQKRFPDVRIVNPLETDVVDWKCGAITTKHSDVPPMFVQDADYIDKWISNVDDPASPLSDGAVQTYFANARLRDDLILYLVPTEDDFIAVNDGNGYIVDFRGDVITVALRPASGVNELYESKSKLHKEGDSRIKRIRVRRPSLAQVIHNGLPWEDLSIGFQCRVHRTPDIYNSDFWFYFTNEYIGTEVAQASASEQNENCNG